MSEQPFSYSLESSLPLSQGYTLQPSKPEEVYHGADALGGAPLIDAFVRPGSYANPLSPNYQGGRHGYLIDKEALGAVADTVSNIGIIVGRAHGKMFIVQPGTFEVLSPGVDEVLAIRKDYVTVRTETGVKIISSPERALKEELYDTSSHIVDMAAKAPRFNGKAARELALQQSRAQVFWAQQEDGRHMYGFPTDYIGDRIVVRDISPQPDDVVAITPPTRDVFNLRGKSREHTHLTQGIALYEEAMGGMLAHAAQDKRGTGAAFRAGDVKEIKLPIVSDGKGGALQLSVAETENGNTQISLEHFTGDDTNVDGGFRIVRQPDGTSVLVPIHREIGDPYTDPPLGSERYGVFVEAAGEEVAHYLQRLGAQATFGVRNLNASLSQIAVEAASTAELGSSPRPSIYHRWKSGGRA